MAQGPQPIRVGPRPRIFTPRPSIRSQRPARPAGGGSSEDFIEKVIHPPKPGGPDSLFEQLSNVVTGLPSGLAAMGVDAARDVQGIGRTVKDLGTGQLGDNPDDYFPLLTGFQHSIARTGGRVGNLAASLVPGGQTPGESEYGRAIKEGRIVPTVLEDAGNAALVGSAVAKGLTAGATAATRGAVDKAATEGLTEEAAQHATAAEAAARVQAAAAHPLGQAATKFNRLIHPVNELVSAPARVWTAPVKAVTGFDLPRIFGTAEDGAPHRVGVYPALKSTGVVDKVLESPTGQAFKTAVEDWHTKRSQRLDVRQNYLMDETATRHAAVAKLESPFRLARNIISDGIKDKELVESYEHANHLIHTGAAPVIRQAVDLARELPQDAWEKVMFQTFGREQMPSPATMDLVLKYTDGTLPADVVQRLDAAWEAESIPLRSVEDVKLEGEGRKFGPMSEEQLGHEPVPYKVEAKLEPWRAKRQQIVESIHGPEGGEIAKGLDISRLEENRRVPTAKKGVTAREDDFDMLRNLAGYDDHVMRSYMNQAYGGAVGDLVRRVGDKWEPTQNFIDNYDRIRSAVAAMEYQGGQYFPEDYLRVLDRVRPTTTVTGTGGLVGELAAAKAKVPTEEPSLLVSARAAAAARRAGALTGEQTAAVKGAERLDVAAGRAGEKVESAKDAALQAERDLVGRPDLTEGEALTYVRSVRRRLRDEMRRQNSEIESKLQVYLPIRIPARGSGEWDAFQAVQDELARAAQGSRRLGETRARFRNLTTNLLHHSGGKVRLFSATEGTPIDDVLGRIYDDNHDLLVADVRRLKENKAAEAAVIRDGFPGATKGDASDPLEWAAMRGDERGAADAVRAAHAEMIAQEPRASMQPWRSLGRAEGRQRVFQAETERADAEAVKLEPRINEAEARAQEAEAAGTGKAVRFGERVGKATRDVQRIQRDLDRKVKRLEWLDDTKLPALEAKYAQGPAEVAPGAYKPPIMAALRFQAAVTQMGADLAEQAGDPSLAGKFEAMAKDSLTTMDALHAAGVYPEYVPGAVDKPTRGSPSMPGGQDQLPYLGATPSEHAKTYGHVPKRITTVQRSLSREMAAVTRNKVAERFTAEIAKPAAVAIKEAVANGALEEHVAAALLERWKVDPSIDLAAELERHDYSGWDPNSPEGTVPDRRVTAETMVIPTPILTEFQRWFKPATENPVIKLYDKATQGFKHSVLALSPQWNVYNIFGNSFMATFGAGETPAALLRQVPELKRRLAIEAAGGEIATPARLRGAGQSAEISRMMADQPEPRTIIGRGINASYKINEWVDNYGRSLVYLAKMAKGHTSEEAVRLSLQAMGDFSNLSPFERNVVRRVVPFYAWMKHVSQATAHLALEHPWRVAVLLHMSDLFSDPSDENLPDWLRGSFHVADGVFLPAGSLNPYATSAGSIFTNPADWPSEALRSLNPVLKLGAGAIGINTSQGRPVTKSPGAGYADEFGRDKFGYIGNRGLAYMASQLIPQGRLFRDLVADPVVRYDTGDPVKRSHRTIPTEGGRWGAVSHDLGLPFMPIFVNEQEQKARIVKAAKARAKARADYQR